MLVKERKEMLRRACRDLLRSKAGSEAARLAGERAQRHFLAEFPPRRGMSLAIYNAVRGEMETEGIREEYLAAGAGLFYPCVAGPGTLAFFPFREGDRWVTGTYGIPEPSRPAGFPPKSDGFDLVLVPGLAFDRCGRRLGKGLGYYDRFLARLTGDTLRVGFAYSEQLVPKVPVDEWDAAMHAIVTEEGVIRCPEGAAP